MRSVRCLRSVASLTTAPVADVADLDPLGDGAALRRAARASALAGRAELLAELAVGDLEAAHGRRRSSGLSTAAAP